MTKFNPFRPSLDVLEARSLMSATIAAEPVGFELENVFVSSATAGDPTAAGKVSYYDLSAVPTETAQTREHILLARQVGGPMTEDAPWIIAGAVPDAAAHKETIEVASWSFGATAESSVNLYRFNGDSTGD